VGKANSIHSVLTATFPDPYPQSPLLLLPWSKAADPTRAGQLQEVSR